MQTLTSDQSSDLQIVVELSSDNQKTADEIAMRHEDSKENDAEEMKEDTMGDDDGGKVEQITENHNEVGKEESGEQLVGKEADRGDVSNKGQTEHQVKVEEDDFQSEGVPTQRENAELTEMSIEESKALCVPVKEEEKPTEEIDKPPEVKEKPVEGGKPLEDGVQSVEAGEKPVEGEKLGEDDDAVEKGIQAEEEDDEEEGCGRFVQIDDEQFEVIDDMDEDSEDDYKVVATHSPSAGENVEQMNEQLTGKDDYKEVADHKPLNENDGQVSEQLPADWSLYQQDYNAQYQNWLSAGMASYESMELGPTLVRLSGEELVLVGIICSYLQLCPSGATSGEIRDHLSRQFKERRKDVVEKLLFSLPVLFRTGESSGNTKWKFCGFEMFQSKSER